MAQLILASTSVYRQELMNRLGVAYKAVAPNVDEEAEKNQGRSPQDLAEHLAKLKARSIINPQAVVIGSDQLIQLHGKIFGKPGSKEKAIQQLTEMAGKTHDLVTSVCVIAENEETLFTDVTKITLRKLSKDEIIRYVDLDQPLDCAGSYKMEKAGVTLVEKIDSKDFTAIQGLPLIQLSQILRKKGFSLP